MLSLLGCCRLNKSVYFEFALGREVLPKRCAGGGRQARAEASRVLRIFRGLEHSIASGVRQIGESLAGRRAVQPSLHQNHLFSYSFHHFSFLKNVTVARLSRPNDGLRRGLNSHSAPASASQYYYYLFWRERRKNCGMPERGELTGQNDPYILRARDVIHQKVALARH